SDPGRCDPRPPRDPRLLARRGQAGRVDHRRQLGLRGARPAVRPRGRGRARQDRRRGHRRPHDVTPAHRDGSLFFGDVMTGADHSAADHSADDHSVADHVVAGVVKTIAETVAEASEAKKAPARTSLGAVYNAQRFGLGILLLLMIGFFSWLIPESFPTLLNFQ